MKRTLLLLSFLLGATLPGRADTLTTTFAGGTQEDGFMFDVVATNRVAVEGFQFATQSSTLSGNIEIYTKADSHVGFAVNAGAWTSLGIYSYPAGAAGSPRAVVKLNAPVLIAKGERRAFYLREAAAVDLALTLGDGVGTLEAADPNLVILEGTAVSGTFTSAFNGRIPNVTVHYNPDFAAPRVTVVGPRTVRVAGSSTTIHALATDDQRVARVIAKYRKVVGGKLGSAASKNIVPAATGLFRLNLKLAPGNNPVTFQAVDRSGRKSPLTRVSVIRTN